MREGWKWLAFSMLVLLGGGTLLGGCTKEPPGPGPVVMDGVAPAPEIAQPESPASSPIPASRPAPTRTAERTKHPISHHVARSRHRPPLARTAHWKALLHAKSAKDRHEKHVKLAAAARKPRATANGAVPLDNPQTR
jgi:hypothetical protein